MLRTIRVLSCDQPDCTERIEAEETSFNIREQAKLAGWNLNSQGTHYCALHWKAKFRLTSIDGGLFPKPKEQE